MPRSLTSAHLVSRGLGTVPLQVSDRQAPFLIAGPLRHPPGSSRGDSSLLPLCYLCPASVLVWDCAHTHISGEFFVILEAGMSQHLTALQVCLCKHQLGFQLLLFSSRGVIFSYFPTVVYNKEQRVFLTKMKSSKSVWPAEPPRNRPSLMAIVPSEGSLRVQSCSVIYCLLFHANISVGSFLYYNEHF